MLIKSQVGKESLQVYSAVMDVINQAICSEQPYTFGVPYEQLCICMNKVNSSDYAHTFCVHCPLGKCLV